MKVLSTALALLLGVSSATANTLRPTEEVLADAKTSATCIVTITHSMSMHAFAAGLAVLADDVTDSTSHAVANAMSRRAEADRHLGRRIERAYAEVIRREASEAGIGTGALDRQRSAEITEFDARLTAALRLTVALPAVLVTSLVAVRSEVDACLEWVEEVEARGR